MIKLDICLIKVGAVEDAVIEVLSKGLRAYFEWNIKPVAEIEIPSQSYNRFRGQFNSSLILHQIKRQINREECSFVLAITGVDLYVEGLNFVFGEADPVNRICIISTHRLRQEFYGDKPNQKLFEKRVLTEAVHEIGHLLNLKHCSNPNCVMFFSNSILDTDRKGFLFCNGCRSKFKILK
ncbi:archaemetzincin [Candidatus Kryptobacter tengchongensis]|nr:archaemetzincin [Candidatus Kryptobacter tengchongensis]